MSSPTVAVDSPTTPCCIWVVPQTLLVAHSDVVPQTDLAAVIKYTLPEAES